MIHETCNYFLKYMEQFLALCTNTPPFPRPPTHPSSCGVSQNFHCHGMPYPFMPYPPYMVFTMPTAGNKPRGQDVCPQKLPAETAQMHQYQMYIHRTDKGVRVNNKIFFSNLQTHFTVLSLSSVHYLTVLCLIYITSLLAQGFITFICKITSIWLQYNRNNWNGCLMKY